MDAPGNSLFVRRRSVLAGAGAAMATAVIGTPARAATRHGMRRRVAALAPRQLAGQRVVYSYPGLTPPAALLQKIRAGEAAGVIFFGENISGDGQIASVTAQLRQANADSPAAVPLLLMTDQEGGLVRRLPGAPVPSQKQVGQAPDPAAAAAQAGTGAGRNLAGVGMNVNLSPVLGVYRRGGDFLDQYQRSYGTNASAVAALGEAFITAQQRTGVAATAKHFPGLGAAAAGQNTDARPVTLGQSLSELRNVDELPYQSAIAAGVKLVMLSWAVYPALDSGNPAGLSATMVQQELRGRLGFTGVTVTDALEAGAVDSGYTTAQRAVLAAGAGMDLLLCSAREVSQGEDAVTGLVGALQSGALDAASFTGAVRRVRELREQLA